MDDDDTIEIRESADHDFLIWEDAHGQLALEFKKAGSVAEALLNPDDDFKSALQLVFARIDKMMEGYQASLENAGHRVFEIKRHNDFTAVEADYGAPAQGLSFFKDLFDPMRSFRYEPVHVVEGVYKTHNKQALQIGVQQKKQGFKIFDGFDESDYPSQIHFSNGGVTRAFSDIVENIAAKYEDLQKEKAQFGVSHRAAMIVPVPTYGLFLWRMEEILEGRDIDILRVRRSENGAVDEISLRNTLDECRSKNIRVLSYYDCNPHNPTGHIRGKEETTRIAKILVDESNHYVEQDLTFFQDKGEDYLKQIRHEPEKQRAMARWIASLQEVWGSIVMIDDMAYEGLEFSSHKKPYSFGQVSREAAQRTAVLKGVSKIGFPGVRIGLVMAHSAIIEPMADKQLTQEFCANSLGVDILTARYGDPAAHGEQFKKHAANLRCLHRHKAGIVEAFFNGLDGDHRLDARQKQKLVKDYARYKGITPNDSAQILKEGLTQFNLAESMDCGFFYRVNCDALRGKPIATKFEGKSWVSTTQIETGNSLYWVFRSFDMHVVPATSQGCPDAALMARITTSLPDPELFRFYDNMRNMQEYFFGKKPQAQLDLFRKNVFQPV